MQPRSASFLHEIEALYRREFVKFTRVAQAISGDPERASEAVQEAFANAIQARDSFRRDGPLEAWVWRILVNAARAAARRESRDVPIEPHDDGAAPTSALAPILRRLPERQRTVLFLRYYADLDYRSIATVLGVEVGTVSATLAAARQAARRAFEEVSQ